MNSYYLATVVLLFATGCVTDANDQGRHENAPYIADIDYRCEGGSGLRIRWWTEKIEVSFDHRQWVLPRALSASGARYFDGVREVWEHQGEVRVSDGHSAPLICRETEK